VALQFFDSDTIILATYYIIYYIELNTVIVLLPRDSVLISIMV